MKPDKKELQVVAGRAENALKKKPDFSYPQKFKYLVKKDILSADDLKTAVARAKHLGKDVEAILMNDFKISKEDIGENLSHHYGCKFVQYSNNIFVPPELGSDPSTRAPGRYKRTQDRYPEERVC